MGKGDFEILNENYSTIPFIIEKQDKMYLDLVRKQILEVVKEGNSSSQVEKDLKQLLNKVYNHQKLQNRRMPTDLIEFIDEAIKKEFDVKKDFSYTPEAVNSVRNEVDKYSVLPFIKNKQIALNGALISRSREILTMTGNQLVDAYIEELEAARQEGRKPYKSILDAVTKRRLELVETSKAVVNRLTSQIYGTLNERDRQMLSRANENLELLEFATKSETDFSRSPKLRGMELENEIKIVKFHKNTRGLGPVSMKKFIEKEIGLIDGKTDLKIYENFLQKLLKEMEVEAKKDIEKASEAEAARLKQIEEVHAKMFPQTVDDTNLKNRIAAAEAEENRKNFPMADFETGGSISDRAGTFK